MGLNPFDGREGLEYDFWQEVEFAQQSNLVPSGYGLHPDEDGYRGYDEIETIEIGRKASQLHLPIEVWKPRTVLWLQSLELMYKILN